MGLEVVHIGDAAINAVVVNVGVHSVHFIVWRGKIYLSMMARITRSSSKTSRILHVEDFRSCTYVRGNSCCTSAWIDDRVNCRDFRHGSSFIEFDTFWKSASTCVEVHHNAQDANTPISESFALSEAERLAWAREIQEKTRP